MRTPLSYSSLSTVASLSRSCVWASSLICGLIAAHIGLAEEARPHWAFQPIAQINLSAKVPDSAMTPVDLLVLDHLRRQQLDLSSAASRDTILRRVTFDLIGLPPTPDEIADFTTDDAPDAYERLLDRLLANPHYGETWGRGWLDLVRYADTAGFNADPVRPLAYQYRDYVIRAFNDDRAYDRFILEQLAGDEAFPERTDALIATGFNRMWPDESNASNIHLARQTALDDLTGNVGAVFLGLSLGCAQCHDHKFDPLSQLDFYRMQSFFAGIVLQDQAPIAAAADLAAYERRLADWKQKSAPLRRELQEIESPAKTLAGWDRRRKFPADVLTAIDTSVVDRTALQHQLAFWSERQVDIKPQELVRHLDDLSRERREELQRQLAELERQRPQPDQVLAGMITLEVSPNPPATRLLSGGSYDQPLETVEPGFPAVLSSETPAITPTDGGSSGRRIALAQWLGNPNNSLAQRVIANRLWQGHFGRGFVANASDFGTQTPRPRNAELLNWLTGEFSRRGQSIKALHRLILSSAVYRQNGRETAAADSIAKDPDNQLYWHFPRQRLSAERIRDAWLAASGQLNDTMFGYGVFPELPQELIGRGGWATSENTADRNRRSVYIFAKRNLPYPMLQSFDFPDMHESCGCRTQVTVAPQALMLLNSGLILDAAQRFAEQLQPPPSTSLPDEIDQAFLTAFGRRPSDREYRLAQKFLRSGENDAADALHPRRGQDSASQTPDGLIDFCHALLNANEFLYVD